MRSFSCAAAGSAVVSDVEQQMMYVRLRGVHVTDGCTQLAASEELTFDYMLCVALINDIDLSCPRS